MWTNLIVQKCEHKLCYIIGWEENKYETKCSERDNLAESIVLLVYLNIFFRVITFFFEDGGQASGHSRALVEVFRDVLASIDWAVFRADVRIVVVSHFAHAGEECGEIEFVLANDKACAAWLEGVESERFVCTEVKQFWKCHLLHKISSKQKENCNR